MDAIDIHTHIVPGDVPAYAGRHAEARWPQMQACPDCRHKNVMIAGKMAKSGITRMVLSPMPELLSYWIAPFFAAAEELGAAVIVHPLRSVWADRIVGPSRLTNFFALPCETSFAIASMMTGGCCNTRMPCVFSAARPSEMHDLNRRLL